MTGLLYILNVACSASQSTLSKQYASRGGRANVFNINKSLIGLLSFLIAGFFTGIRFHLPTVLLGIGYGAFFSVSNYAGFTALSLGPMALTSIIASFSLIIPFLVGITLWGETLTLWGTLGIILLVSSILMLNYRKSNEKLSLKWTIFTLLTFTSNGICSLIQKQHQLMYPGSFRTEFMICAMACMVVILLAVIWVKKEAKSTLTFCLQGSTAGFLEAAANYIVLFLAATQNASVLFPVVSVAKILAVWVIGRIAFHEKTRFLQTLGLVAGIAAILLLNL